MIHSVTPSAWAQRALRLAILLLAAAFAPAALGQYGTWLDVDVQGAIGAPTRTDDTRPGGLFFFTDLLGIRGPTPFDPDRDTAYLTSDGGRTWRERPGTVDIPLGALDDGYAWYETGHITTDGGVTRRDPVDGEFTDYAVATRTHHAGVRRANGVRPSRLEVSSDGGETWTILDAYEPGSMVLSGTTLGPLPAPPLMPDPTFGWARLGGYRGSILGVISYAQGTIEGRLTTAYFLNLLDLEAGTIRSVELPMWRDQQHALTVRSRPTVAVLSPSRIIVTENVWDTYLLSARFEKLWRSEDGGVTWQPHDTLKWLDEPRLRFFSETFGVTSNARTTDGGRTWQRWGRPFGSAFFARDSAHWHVAGEWMLVGQTTDAGRTWTRHTSAAPYRAVLAHGGNVVIARDQRSVLTSSDRGATWLDVGRAAGMPDDLSHIVAMSWLDTASLPGTIVAVAGFVDEQARRSARVVMSSDYGRTWTERGRVPMLDQAVFASDIDEMPLVFQAVPGIEGGPGGLYIGGTIGLIASTDDGVTWELRNGSMPIHALAMNSRSSGVAMSGDWDNSSIGLYRTADGGLTWEHTMTTPFGFVYPIALTFNGLGYDALVADLSTDWQEWIALSSIDGGTWRQRRGGHDGPAVKGGDAWWLGPDRFIMVGRGASILASHDGGWSLTVHRDRDERFVHMKPSTPTADSMYRPLLTARDGRDIWIADWFRNVGRWTMAEEVLSAPIVASRDGIAARLALSGDRGAAVLTIDGATRADAWLVDMLGARRRIELERAGASLGARIELASLAAGRYVVSVRSAAGALALPLVVAR